MGERINQTRRPRARSTSCSCGQAMLPPRLLGASSPSSQHLFVFLSQVCFHITRQPAARRGKRRYSRHSYELSSTPGESAKSSVILRQQCYSSCNEQCPCCIVASLMFMFRVESTSLLFPACSRLAQRSLEDDLEQFRHFQQELENR